ncbi:hypothetical protein AQUCO_01800021v1 [Aquilegia coerulea]|uniref:O-fucosyltransferase family protein n=2 Tax=Aquilegia coerulea TaxID=218851 RepID=A0A2G5DJG7_AQUCA|nr:hypothetical protein AQUCO_01800021v1 [Aquilegia coerulea]
MDPKQVLGAFLTLTMFTMLGNMIKKDHFDTNQVSLQDISAVQFDASKLMEQSLVALPRFSKAPWKDIGPELKPCWTKQGLQAKHSKGFIVFSLTNGPEYHISQMANAVVVARHLGAVLVLPDIRGNNIGDTRYFQEIYDLEKFMKSVDGVVEVTKSYPDELVAETLDVVRVPNRVTEDHIGEHIEPIFRKKGSLRLATYFPTMNMKKTKENKGLDSVVCLAMYETLKLQPEVHEVVDSMVEKLRTLSRKSDGQFIAVDLRIEMLEKKGCQGSGGSGKKRCYNAQEIGIFLRNIGFDRETTIYLTQSRWHKSLDALKKIFPKTYTKEGIMPVDKKEKFLNLGSSELEKALDFSICSQSDVFVPAISGLFYANVVGKRIESGRTQILVPGKVTSSSSVADFISPYISKKNHMAYSCFC